jgi:hypothetical protein
MKDKLKLKGSLEAVLIKGDGTVDVTRKDNIIVDVGFDFIADAIGDASTRPAAMSHIALGSGNSAPAPGNTALEAELDRNAATYEHTAGTKTFTFQATFPAGDATGAITEAGVINAASGGILLDRVTFGVINKGADDTLQTTFTFTMS